MPIYMDRHDLPAVTAKDVAEAHNKDLKIQAQFNCRALTYWFDEKRNTAFCLIEGPDETSVEQMHNHAHGLVPHQIIEVNPQLVEAFLGRISDPGVSISNDSTGLNEIKETAFRTLMAVTLKGLYPLLARCKDEKAVEAVSRCTNWIRQTVKELGGAEAEHTSRSFLFSFMSVVDAVTCAVKIQKSISTPQVIAGKLQLQIGLSAGVPVTNSKELFGEAVRLAKRLSVVANDNKLMISSTVRDLCRDEDYGLLNDDLPVKMCSPEDEAFLNKLIAVIEQKYIDPALSIQQVAKAVAESKSQLYRKTICLTALSPNDFIHEFRLYKAQEKIEKQQGNIAEIAYTAGFTSPSYFSKCFQKKFGLLPSQYAAMIE